MCSDNVLRIVRAGASAIFKFRLKKLNLGQYDGQCVRVVVDNGNVFEGICVYRDKEYCEREYGRKEERLEMEAFIFFPRDIVSVESLEGNSGPYGRFTVPYSDLEMLAVEDGFGYIKEALESEESEHVVRLLNCIDEYLYIRREIPWRSRLPEALKRLLVSNKDPEVQATARKMLERFRRPVGSVRL